MEDTLEKAGGEETMSDKLKVNMNEYLPHLSEKQSVNWNWKDL